MKVILRPYQKDLIDETRIALQRFKRVLLSLPTGGGKTICFSSIVAQSQKYNRKVLILSSRSEILLQSGGALERFNLNPEYITPKHKDIPKGNVVVAMAQTLKRRVEKEEWRDYLKTVEILIIDEAHEQVSDFIHDYMGINCFILGVTATPRRYGNMRQLGDMYDAMVYGVSVQTLIDQNYLSPARHFSITAPKMDDCKIDSHSGDYNTSDMARRFEDKKIYINVVDEYLRVTPGKKAIFFCCSSTQTIEFTKELRSRGVSAKYLLSGSFDEDEELSGNRAEVIQEFKEGKFQVLVNLGIAVAGFDVPDVEVVVLNFATISLTKYLQCVGRGSRVAPNKKEFFILDCGENYRKHGKYEDDRKWLLWHDNKPSTGPLMYKICPVDKRDIKGRHGCGEMIPPTCKVCPKCGYKFPTKEDKYILRLEEIAAQEGTNVQKFAAIKKLQGWNTNRILVQVLLANIGQEHHAFSLACQALGIDPKYWYVFKEKVWKTVNKKYKNAYNKDTPTPDDILS